MSKTPFQSRTERIIATEQVRSKAASAPHSGTLNTLQTQANCDEDNYQGEAYPSSFTKGLQHNDDGILVGKFETFRDEINGPPPKNFSDCRPNAVNYKTKLKSSGKAPAWRGWESPRTGHYHDLEGPDADAVGMAPAPELGTTELSLEMAEVYAMALLRDVRFTDIENGVGKDKKTGISTQDVLQKLTASGLFSLHDRQPTNRRLAARLLDPDDYDVDEPISQSLPGISKTTLFRGSGPGAKKGHFVSQFMLAGNKVEGNEDVRADPRDGYIKYGNQFIDQRGLVFTESIDHMINWQHWLDVQNGADLGSANPLKTQRFISTPRDLATYVRFDALYQAYLNACLIMLGTQFNSSNQKGFQVQPGFPEQGGSARTGFASFGGPHILSLVTEVATRCLKAARRQKFNYHRRGRPERIGGLLSLAAGNPAALGTKSKNALSGMLSHLSEILPLVAQHNKSRISTAPAELLLHKQVNWLAGKCDHNNFLLPMAFAEGSPMHPAYAAGHATVAGGCVTMLKAFFRTLDDNHKPLLWSTTGLDEFVPDDSRTELTDYQSTDQPTIEGELNKLAANISIGRNMAGVHYYSDYYDSLRMGERIAVGILMEQLLTFENLAASSHPPEKVEIVFRSFDGDVITLSSLDPFNPVITQKGRQVRYVDWIGRHVPPNFGRPTTTVPFT